MNWIWLAVAVFVVFAAIYFIDKKTFVKWVVDAIEIIAAGLVSLFIAFIVSLLTAETSIGIVAVGIVFYFFGGLIRPYIKEFVEKITKNFGEKE